MTGKLIVPLFDFTWSELAILTRHLQYAAGQLEQELTALRLRRGQRHFLPQPDRTGSVTLQHWAGLLRDQKYFAALAQAVEQTATCHPPLLFLPDGEPPAIDLTPLITGDSRPLATFIERELRRAQLAVDYVHAQPFDGALRYDLLYALDIEIRLFTAVLGQMQSIRPSAPAPLPEPGEHVPLMFVSLPQPLVQAKLERSL
jgi:hypothetical protein